MGITFCVVSTFHASFLKNCARWQERAFEPKSPASIGSVRLMRDEVKFAIKAIHHRIPARARPGLLLRANFHLYLPRQLATQWLITNLAPPNRHSTPAAHNPA
jgi:hypothetical protein